MELGNIFIVLKNVQIKPHLHQYITFVKNCGKKYLINNTFKDIQQFCCRDCYFDYKNKNSKIQIKYCPNCSMEFKTYHKDQICCSYECSREYNRRTNLSYKKLDNFIRSKLAMWRLNARKLCGNKCAITGRTDNIELHHIVGVTTLLKEALENLNMEKYDFDGYSTIELDEIWNEYKRLQDEKGSYICIHRDIHKEFHKIYGCGFNTEEQWNEFIENKEYILI